MTNQQILEKAIQKAIDGGWQPEDWVQGPKHLAQSLLEQDGTYQLIFNHDFAKALWGEKLNTSHYYMFDDGSHWRECDDRIAEWQYHLQQMVIADDPIKYLGDNL